MYRTDFWTLWEKATVRCFERTASKHVYYLGWNRSPAQVGCMRQTLGPGALGRPRGIGWRGRWEGGWGWGIHVYPWLIHVNVWQKPLQYYKVISLQLIKKKKKLNIQKTKIMASGPITSWQIHGETMETVTYFTILGSKTTADGDCSHELKRHLLLGRKSMTNLDNILKNKDLTLSTKVHLFKAMVFPAVMCGCENFTVKKAEQQRTELWCWRRLLRVRWTARQFNQSILNEINPECSLEGQMLKLKLKYFDHLMWRADSLEKTLMLGMIELGRRRGNRGWVAGWHHRLNGHEFEQAPGVGHGQGRLVCCSPWGLKELNRLINWTKLTEHSKMAGIEWKTSSHSFSPAHLAPSLSLYVTKFLHRYLVYNQVNINTQGTMCFCSIYPCFSFYITITIYYMYYSASWFFTLKIF